MAALPEFEAVLADLDERGLRRRRRSVRRLSHDTAEIELDGRRVHRLLQQRLPRPLRASARDRGPHRGRARARRRRPRLAPHHRTPGASTTRSRKRSPRTPGANARCCSRPATWRTSGSRPRSCRRAGGSSAIALNHASLIDAGRIARAPLDWYAHGDAAALEGKLAARRERRRTGPDRRRLQHGRRPRAAARARGGLRAGTARCSPWTTRTASACSGASGGGSLEHFGLTAREVPALVGTLGKAFGSFGAFVAGDADLIETLIQRARTYIYTTALPVAVAAATRAALEVSIAESWRRVRVLALTQRFRRLAAEAGLPLAPSETPIQPVLLGGADDARRGEPPAARARLLRRRDPPADGAGRHVAPSRRALGGAPRRGRRGPRRGARRLHPAPHERPQDRAQAGLRFSIARPSAATPTRASAGYDDSAVLAGELRGQMHRPPRVDRLHARGDPRPRLRHGPRRGRTRSALAARARRRARRLARDAAPRPERRDAGGAHRTAARARPKRCRSRMPASTSSSAT